MITQLEGKKKLFAYAAVTCCALAFILQFVPFWFFNGKTATINGYIWLPFTEKSKELGRWIASEGGKPFKIDDILLFPIIQMISSGVSVVNLIINGAESRKPYTFPLICALAGILVYNKPIAYFLSPLVWVHIVITVALIASVVGMIIYNKPRK